MFQLLEAHSVVAVLSQGCVFYEPLEFDVAFIDPQVSCIYSSY